MDIYNKEIQWYNIFDNNNQEYNIKYINISNIDNVVNNSLDISKLNYNSNFSINNELIIKKINNILDKNIQSYPSIYELIKEQNLISAYLDKYILQNNVISKSFVLKILNWLLDTSIFLSNKLNLEPQYHQVDSFIGLQNIPRCSYKFCSFKENCTYNYDSTKNGCYSDHYVYNMLTADIKVIIDYIELNHPNIEKITYNKELLKCINTLNFVIKHMYDEYNVICMTIEPSQYNKYFVNNKIVEKKFKKDNFKKKSYKK
jgi:hypothetical protein